MASVVPTTFQFSVSSTLFKWRHKNNQTLIIILMMVVAMFLSIGIQAFNFYQIINSTRLQNNTENKTIVKKYPSTMKSEDFDLLFGFNNSHEITQNNKEIPVTKMNLILRGILSGFENKKYDSAIIQTSNQDRLYEIGDALPGGVILHQVYSDHIVIKRGTRFEKLYFPETASDSRTFQEFRPVAEASPEAVEQRPGNHDYPDDMSLEQRMQDLREKLQEVSQEL